MLDLIIKNGECYIQGRLFKTNIGIKNSKISIISDLINNISTSIRRNSNTRKV